MEDKFDLVIPLGTGSRMEDIELKYCLRSFEKNFKQLGNVYIVGTKPKWLSDKAIHVKFKDTEYHNKDGNIIDKVKVACLIPEISQQLIWSCDDHLISQPMIFEDFKPCYVQDVKVIDYPTSSSWHKRLQHTYKYLKSKGLTTKNFDSHIPQVIDKSLFIKIANDFPYKTSPGFCINTMYFNAIKEVGDPIADKRLCVEKKKKGIEYVINKKLNTCKYVMYNDIGLILLLPFIMFTFVDKSKYEI
jgi:hypothetical protein